MRDDIATVGEEEAEALTRVIDYLRDAIVELEVWRQNARTPDERHALHRVTALLNHASSELRVAEAKADPAQHALHLSGAI